MRRSTWAAEADHLLGGLSLAAAGNPTLTIQDADSLTLSGAGISATGTSGTATIAGSVPIKNAAGTIAVPGGTVLVIASPLVNGSGNSYANSSFAQTNSLTVSGGGLLALAASNTYSGPTTVSGGTLQLGTGASNGSISGAVSLNNGVLINDPATSGLTFTNSISGTGAVVYTGSTSNTFTYVTGNMTYTGPTTVGPGGIQQNSPSYVSPSSDYTLVGGGGNQGLYLSPSANSTYTIGALNGAGGHPQSESDQHPGDRQQQRFGDLFRPDPKRHRQYAFPDQDGQRCGVAPGRQQLQRQHHGHRRHAPGRQRQQRGVGGHRPHPSGQRHGRSPQQKCQPDPLRQH